jgi:integrase/recombinase XerD
VAKRGAKLAEPKLSLLLGSGLVGTLATWARAYVESLAMKNFSKHTLDKRERDLAAFITWSEPRAVMYPQEVTKPILERYQRHLFQLRQANGRPLSFGAQASRAISLRLFFKWLTRQNVVLYNPASELELPRLEQRLPRAVLTLREVETVMNLPDTTTALGLRDRAILEVLYSTGMRRAELISLRTTDVDRERGTAIIRQGKGKKDRVAPVGERACAWVEKYLYEVRPELVCGFDEGILFLTKVGESFTPSRLTNLARRYVMLAKLGKSGSCHLFRHTAATLMLEGGADIRHIQALLGHVDISTTQLYAQVSIRLLQQVHRATHPGATLERRARGDALADDESDPSDARDELILSLAADVEDEGGELDESEQ